LTALVQETWAETLDVFSVGPDDAFFELGGDSLMVATAVARLGERLGIDLPPRALFEAPTPAEMAELIEELHGARDCAPLAGITPFVPDWVVPLQREGAGRPVFVFPAGHAEVPSLAREAQVASLAGRDHPFWGFRRDHPHLERAREDGVSRLATEYVNQMRTIQGTGPYLLYANCVGGYLAWDVAGQLLAAGDEIAGILFYEVPLRSDFDTLLRGSTPAHTSSPWGLSHYYRPHPLPVDLTLLMTEAWHDRGWSTSWQRVARGTVETIVMSKDLEGCQDLAGAAKVIHMTAGHVRDWIQRMDERVRIG
jgi:acyl carrier protein